MTALDTVLAEHIAAVNAFDTDAIVRPSLKSSPSAASSTSCSAAPVREA